jgi:hypothetical protein
MSSRLGVVAVALMLLLAASSRAGEQLRIGTISMQLDDVYPSVDGVGPQFPYSLANALHRRTREQVVRRELLFAPGDPYRPELLAETERNLRRFVYLRLVRVEASEPHDGVVDVAVHTVDAWTTKVQLNLGRSGGKLTGSAGLVEDNLLGRGKSFSAFYVVDSERTSTRLFYQDPRILGQFLTLSLGYFVGDRLQRFQAQLYRPFSSTLTRWSWGALVDRGDFEDFLYDRGEKSLSFDQNIWRGELYVARALGASPDLIRRVRIGWRYSKDGFLPETGAEPLPDSFRSADRQFSGPLVGFELRRQSFIRETNINTYVRDEDFNLGTQLSGEIGVYPEWFGSRGSALWTAVSVTRGLGFGPGHFALGSIRASGRLEGGELRGGALHVQASYYRRMSSRLTLAAVTQFDVLRNADPETQLTLGGDEGLRGYKLRLFTGNKSMLSRLEGRVLLIEDLLKLCSVGAVGFADAGNAWRVHQVPRPFDQNVDLGAGLRVTFPRSSRGNVLRFDVSYALQENGFESPWLVSFGASQSF